MTIAKLTQALAKNPRLEGVPMDLIRNEAERLVTSLQAVGADDEAAADYLTERAINCIVDTHKAKTVDRAVEKVTAEFGG